MKCGDGMDKFKEVLKKAMRTLRCPLQVIAKGAGVSRSTVYYALNGTGGMRFSTLRMITSTVLHELEKERIQTQKQADELSALIRELRTSLSEAIEVGDKK